MDRKRCPAVRDGAFFTVRKNRPNRAKAPTQPEKGTSTGACRLGRGVRALDAPDVRAEAAQLADDVLIAALDIFDLLHTGRALGGQTRNDHCGARAQVAGVNRAAGKALNARDDGGLGVDLDARAHAVQLGAIAEARVIDALGDDARAPRQRHTDGDLRLHIRREAGIGQGLHIGAAQLAGALDADGIVVFRDLRAHLAQLGGDAVHVLGDDVLNQNVAAHGGDGSHIRPGLDLVGDDGIAAAAQRLHAAHLDDVRARAGDLRAHGVEKVGEVDDVRLLGGVFDDGRAAREDRADHDVHRRADGDDVEIDTPAGQTVFGRSGADEAVLQLHLRADGLEALDVLVDRPRAEVTAAGQRHAGVAEAAELRADQVV